MSRINPRQIEAFNSVMKAGGITPASIMMNVTQPAISRLIKDFEIAVGLQLFDREGKRLVARAEALSLFGEVEKFYLGIDKIRRAANDIAIARALKFRLGSVPAIAGSPMRKVVTHLLKSYPDLELSIDVESTSHIADLVNARQYDLGLAFHSPRLHGLTSVSLGQTKAVAVVARTHPLATSSAIRISDLSVFTTFLPGRKTTLRQCFDEVANAFPAALKAVETSMSNCCSFAASGEGIGIVDPLSASAHRDTLAILPFEPEIAVHYVAVRSPQAPRSAVLDDIIDVLRSDMAPVIGEWQAA